LFYEKDKELNYFINFNLNRTGNMSTYGDIHINYVSRNNTVIEVAKIKGVAVYTPGDVRKVKIQLKTPKNIKRGLQVLYSLSYFNRISKVLINKLSLKKYISNLAIFFSSSFLSFHTLPIVNHHLLSCQQSLLFHVFTWVIYHFHQQCFPSFI